MFSREPAAAWLLEALTDRYVVRGSADPDDQSSAMMFLTAQFKQAPLTRLRLGAPQVQAVGGGPAPTPSAAWTFAYGSALVALLPRDEASSARALDAAAKASGPAVAYVGPHRIAGTLRAGGNPELAAQQPSFVMTDAQVVGAEPVAIAPAPVLVVFTNLLHAIEFA
jgi:hypothetical protein